MMTTILQIVLVVLSGLALAISIVSITRRRSTESAAGIAGTDSRLGSAGYVWESPAEPGTDSDGKVSQYRVRPGSSQDGFQWDPYAEDQSRRHRVQSARRKPRPARSSSAVKFTPAPGSSGVDHYAVLGVRPEATDAEIERAYRRYAAEIHPDRFFDDPSRRSQAEEKLKQLNGIMQTLRDPLRRAEYDASR